MYHKNKDYNDYLISLHSACKVIWSECPESMDLDLSLIKNPGHILDWCDDKMFDIEGFIYCVSGNYISKNTSKLNFNISYSNGNVYFSSEQSSFIGSGKNLLFAISDYILHNNNSEELIYEVSMFNKSECSEDIKNEKK
jgi:hypothetical protein